MNRRHLILALLAACTALALWLLRQGQAVSPTDPNEPSQISPVAPAEPEASSATSAGASGATERRPAPDSPEVSAAADPAPKPRGLHGVVKEIEGGGLADIILELVDKNGVTIASTMSGEGGRFAFEIPPSSKWSLVSRPTNSDGPRLRHWSLPTSGQFPMAAWRPPSGVIEGAVIDASGRPVAGAYVATDRPWLAMGMLPWEVLDGPKPQMVFDLRTDENGRFVMRFLKQGKHRLRATFKGEAGSAVCDARERGVVLRLGAHHGGNVVLEGALTDRVTGRPIAGARVSVQRVRKSSGGFSSVGVAQDITDERGRYEFAGLDVGTYGLHSLPRGYASGDSEAKRFEAGRHTVDFVLDPARKLRVRVLLPDGKPATGAEVRVARVGGERVRVPGQMRMMSDGVAVGEDGFANLRRLPATVLVVRALRGDYVPAGESRVDLSTGSPGEITIRMPTRIRSFPRHHFFTLTGEDGKPVAFEGEVVASCFDAGELVSRVRGHWRGKEFVFGNYERNGFAKPSIPVGAPAGECRVEIAVPGYQVATLTLAPGAKSPTRVRLQR